MGYNPMMKKLPLILLGLMLVVASVSAHGYIEHTFPVDGAELDAAPERIEIWFNEALVPDSGSISIVTGNGETITPERVYHAPDSDLLLIAELPPNLPQGAYVVTASATVVSDGHQPTGSIVFWIGQRSAIAAAAPPDDSPAYIMVPVFLGILAVFGGLGFFWMRQSESTPLRPSSDIDHYPLSD